MEIINVQNLKKRFGSTQALDGIDLSVHKGQIYGFIGPNGAGKTTAIRVLLGIIKGDSGTASIFANNVWDDAVIIHKHLAYVPGEVNLWPNLTGGEVIDLFLRFTNSSNISRKRELMQSFDFDPTKKCRSYSKGNRQKIALIAAFASDAELFIFDEPTTGLDPLMENVFHEQVRKVQREGKTVFLSSHRLSEVEKLCDTLSIIRKGRIIETGTLASLRHLRRLNITLKTHKPIDALQSIDGIHAVRSENGTHTFQADRDKIGSIIKTLAPYDVTLFQSAPPTLEDLFMHYYEETSDK